MDNYKDLCIEAVSKFIKNSVRHPVIIDNLEDYNAIEFDFKIRVNHVLSIKTHQSTLCGIGHAEKQDEVCRNINQWKHEAQKQNDAEKINPKHLDNLYLTIKKAKYAQFVDMTTLYTLDKKFLYEYKCSECRGCGEIDCAKCRGKGEVKCAKCVNGEVRCSQCDGKKNIIKSRQIRKGQSWVDEKYAEPCSKCHASGKLACHTCKGCGYIVCGKCSGSGILECPECRGEGCLTDYLATRICTTSHYTIEWTNKDFKYLEKAQDIISKLNIVDLESYGNVKRESIEQYDDSQTILEIYKIFVPIALFAIHLNDKVFYWAVYGKNATYVLDLDKMVEHLLLIEVQGNLCKVAKGHVWNLIYSCKTIREFAESQINQELLDKDKNITSKKLPERAEQLQNAMEYHLSEEYITQSLGIMDKIAKTYCYEVNFFWFIVGIVVSFESISISHADFPYNFLPACILLIVFALCAKGQIMISARLFWGKHIYDWIQKRYNKLHYFTFPLFGIAIIGLILGLKSYLNN